MSLVIYGLESGHIHNTTQHTHLHESDFEKLGTHAASVQNIHKIKAKICYCICNNNN